MENENIKVVSGTISFLTSIMMAYMFIHNTFMYFTYTVCGRPYISIYQLITQFFMLFVVIFYLIFTKFWKKDFTVSDFRVKRIYGTLYLIIIFLQIVLTVLFSDDYVILLVIMVMFFHIIYLFISKFWESPKTKEND